METQNEVHRVKYVILDDLKQALKLVLRYSVDGAVLGNDSCLVQSLTHTLDRILRHGLRDLHTGYWPIVQEVTHSSTIQIISSLKSVHSLLGKGRAWLYFTLTEGSLESYLKCLLRDKQTLKKHYLPHSLMRDESAFDLLLEKVGNLQNVQFILDPDVAYLDMSTYKQQALLDSQTLSSMTTSLTSSLASPVDSGVALLDSDFDATSVSEATCSLRDDDSSVTEMDLIRDEYDIENTPINSTLLTDSVLQEITAAKPILCEAILLKSNNADTSTVTTKVRNLRELEEALLNDAAAHLAHNAIMHNPGYREAQSESCDIADEQPSTCEVINSDFRTKIDDTVNTNVDVVNSQKSNQDGTLTTAPLATNKLPTRDKKTDGATDCDEIVFRRQRKKNKSKAEVKVKRVSFHEDVLSNTTNNVKQEPDAEVVRGFNDDIHQTLDFSASFLPPNAVIKRDVVKGRYSWCAEGDAPYMQQLQNDTKSKSDVYVSSDHSSESYQNISSQCVNYKHDTRNQEKSNALHSDDESVLRAKMHNRRLQAVPSYNYSALESKLKSFSIQEEQYSQSRPAFVDQKCNMLQMESILQLSSSGDCVNGIVGERGIPEGQEDPQKINPIFYRNAPIVASLSKVSSMASNLDCFSDSESAADFNARRSLVKRNSVQCSGGRIAKPAFDSRYERMSTFDMKATLLNRFLKLVTIKKFVEKQAETKLLPRSMYIKGIKFDPEINKEYDKCLNEEIIKGCDDRLSDKKCNVDISSEMESLLKISVFSSNEEKLYKVFRIRGCYFVGGLSVPLLFILTDVAVYVTGVKDNYTYCNHFVLHYINLDTVLVGPNGHGVELASVDRQARFMFVTGDCRVTESLVGSIELAMRKLKGCKLPGIRCLDCDDMGTMRRSLIKQAAIFEEDPLLHYGLVFLQDDQSSSPCTPLGPTKEGHLMYRIATTSSLGSWTPGYFMLKAGALYIFEDQGHRLPKQVLMLRNGQCKGCQRLVHDRRPHTFQIILGWARAVQFAASNEYEASDWLQTLIQAAAGAYEEDNVATTACTLALTAQRIVTCIEHFPSGHAQALSVANIGDLMSYHASDQWCVLEFACQEVNENSGDWILYFTSVFEREIFQQNLHFLWKKIHQQTEFPLKITLEDYLAMRCSETSQLLNQAWDQLLTGQTLQ